MGRPLRQWTSLHSVSPSEQCRSGFIHNGTIVVPFLSSIFQPSYIKFLIISIMAPSGLLATSQFVSDGLSIFLPTIAFGIAQQFTPISLTVNSTWPLVASGVGIVIGIYYVKVASPKFFGISLVLYTVQYSFLTAWTLTSCMFFSLFT